MNLNYISLKRYLRYLKFPLLFCAAFFAGAAAGKIISHYTQNPASVPSSSQSSSWGLSFQEEGKRPVGNATIEELSQYDAFFAENTDEKKIYLTFDAGYENGNVEKILDVLKEKNAPGAFFILPQLAKENTDLVRRMREEGHLICNHTKTHRNMSKITDFETFAAELQAAEDILLEYTGLEMDKFYRPPEGRFSEQNLEFADRLGYTTVFWSLAYADWDNEKQLAPARALDLILARTHNGCVALLHPTSATNAAILGSYIDALRADGYTFGSLTELTKPQGGIEDVQKSHTPGNGTED